MQRSITKISLLFLSIAVQAKSQQISLTDTSSLDSVRTYQLREIIVTATRGAKDLHDVGRSVTIITSNEIRSNSSMTLTDLLSRQAGVYIVGAAQTPGSLQGIYLRGANTNQTVVLFDGIPITDPSSTDNAIDFSELSLVGVEKIELVRGSYSTMYGSSAIGGVINLVSHRTLSPGLHTHAAVDYGTFGKSTSSLTQHISLDYSLNNGLFLGGGLFSTKVNGINATIDTMTGSNRRPDQDDFSKTDIIGKIGYNSSRIKAHLSFKQANQKSDIDDGSFQDDDNYTIETRRRILSGIISFTFSDSFNVSYIGGVTDLKRMAIDDSSVVDNFGITDHSYLSAAYEGSTVTNELQGNILLSGLEMSLGVGMLEEKMSSDIYFLNSEFAFESRSRFEGVRPRATTKNAFLHADLSGILLGEAFGDLSLGLGVRYNKHNSFGRHTTYEINPTFKVSTTTLLYASYSTGFLTPPLYRLYALEQDMNSGITRGNKGLKPESSLSFEVGVKQTVGGNTLLTASYFSTSTDDIIEYVYLWEQNKPVNSLTYLDYRGDTYLNLGRHRTRGIEIEVTSQVTDEISLTGNLSFIGGTLSYDPSRINTSHTKGYQVQVFANGLFLGGKGESLGLVRRPNTANLRMMYAPVEDLKVMLEAIYVGQRSDFFYEASLGPFGGLSSSGLGDYGLINIAARYVLMENLTMQFMVQNLLNAQYSEIRGYNSVGRSIFAGLRHTI